MNILKSIGFAAAMASLSACGSAAGGGNAAARQEQSPLAGATIGGAFDLIDQTGERFTDRDLAGHYAIVYFGYTYCPDVCPVDVQKLTQGLAAFAKRDAKAAADIVPVFVSVDPGRDTPDVLENFVASFSPQWIGLTGKPEQIAKVAKEYAVSYNRVEGSTPDAYLMAHSQMAFLMGPDGKPIALLPLDDPSTEADEGSAGAIADELAKWVRPAA